MEKVDSNDDTRLHTVLVVYGTRPEAIKLAPLVKVLDSSSCINAVTVVTGQHKHMIEDVHELFDFSATIRLDPDRTKGNLNTLSSKLVLEIDQVLSEYHPSAVVVQGDTTSACATAIAAFNRGIHVVHLEAGLRTGNLRSPYPEEGNRRIISQIASLHLCPTQAAEKNLAAENLPNQNFEIIGNTIIDALLTATSKTPKFSDRRIERVLKSPGRKLVVTTHRRENWGSPLINIAFALKAISSRYPKDWIIFPLHANPSIRNTIEPVLRDCQNIILTPAMSYVEFCNILAEGYVILTDSGGIQEEAPVLGKPVLVLRQETERIEAVLAGTAKLVGTETGAIVQNVSALYDNRDSYDAMSHKVNPYGDGHAASYAVNAISKMLAAEMRASTDE